LYSKVSVFSTPAVIALHRFDLLLDDFWTGPFRIGEFPGAGSTGFFPLLSFIHLSPFPCPAFFLSRHVFHLPCFPLSVQRQRFPVSRTRKIRKSHSFFMGICAPWSWLTRPSFSLWRMDPSKCQVFLGATLYTFSGVRSLSKPRKVYSFLFFPRNFPWGKARYQLRLTL